MPCFSGPPPDDAGWPRDRIPFIYDNNMELCTKILGLSYNLGCVCHSPGAQVDCSIANGADPVLFNAEFNEYTQQEYGDRGFKEWCESDCQCLDEEDQERLDTISSAERQGVIDRAVVNTTDPYPVNESTVLRGFTGTLGADLIGPGTAATHKMD
ncbi:MAG: hypothetical protein M1828_007641 [Chrysothrix sp. TS-e1954]|nr:MAG: hypothetical protein M1828_007641 [Chrysothrix sp. TS-e1954]